MNYFVILQGLINGGQTATVGADQRFFWKWPQRSVSQLLYN